MTSNKSSLFTLPKSMNILMFIILFALALHSQIGMFNYGSWNDEFETIVVSRMMATGLHLYRDIFDQHGPMIFAIGYLLEICVDSTVLNYRIFIAILQWIMIGCLLFSRPEMPPLPRLLGIAIVIALLLVTFPRVYGQMFLYQTVAGLFGAVAITLLVLPVLQGDQAITRPKAIAGGLLLGCLPFLAFTYAIASAGLIICALNKQTWRSVITGVALAIILNTAFIVTRCSISGLIADHLYLNLVIYPPFGDAGWSTAGKSLMLASMIGLMIVVASAGYFVLRRNTAWWRVAAFVLALTSLLVRGPDFQASPFYYGLLPLVFTAMEWVPLTNVATRFASYALILVCMMKASLLLPSDILQIEKGQIPTHSTFSDLVKRYTEPSDKIISYSFNNFEYIASDRLPAAADFYFLPQQAEYDAHPVLGIVSDPCKEIPATRPKFVKLDKWLAWGKFPWTSYGACVDVIMQDSYQHVEGTQIYIRNDIYPLVDQATIPRDGGSAR